MLRRVLLVALVCVAVWASGHRSEGVAAPSTTFLHPLDGHAGNPASSTDVWQSARAVVVVQTWRLPGHPGEIPATTPTPAPRLWRAASPAPRRPPPAPPHTFELPLLI
jgi:hypothetical protein